MTTTDDPTKGPTMTEHDLDITKTNIAVERLIAVTENPRHRFLLEAYNRHRYLEMAGRYEEIFAPDMMVAEPVYRFNYLGKVFDLVGREQVEAVYHEWAVTDQCIFYTADEQVAVGDGMVCSRTIGYQQVTGAALAADGMDADPNAMYLAKSLETMIWPYDERGRLIGEEVWEFDQSAREIIELAPDDVLTVAQARELLDPLIRPLPSYDEVVAAGAPFPA